ncbi:RNI-like protein [Macrolepiota fuliginosa MF-IS2]|uniref:RNI-like protein n=1 Tax=Macrolepiota fuliginosa MF-IS2 TaxID=1400762 RepID=A0A9P5XPN6_9AGAR|nr:RNI-like protein [Macrolepiota fuliginosa MF-IS2]
MSSAIFSLQGRGLKLDSAADIDNLLKDADPTVIEEIHLSGNTIGVDASRALAIFLQKTKVLKVANFADIFTGRLISEIPLALTAICDALKDKPTLIELNLSDNAFGGRSVDPIVPFLTHNRSFQILKLNNNGLGPAGGCVIADALRESALLSKKEGKKSNLRVVICGRNRLENGSAQAWADAFAAHGTLEEVRMPQNGIRMEGVTALAAGLKKNPGLQVIDLQDNTFTADGQLTGVEAWADALASWPELGFLNLSDCVLSGGGEVPTLLETLAEGSNPKLHTLQLQNNNLETATFELLAKNVGPNLGKLLRLELQWNDGEDDDEHLENLGIALKARGGKLYVTDEDEEEEEEEKEKEEEEEEPEEDSRTAVDKATDDLADLLAKVTVK